MRNLRVLALLAGLGWCCRAQAAVDCNMPEFEFVNDAYVCLSGTFKAQNNQIQDMEDKLKRPSEKIRNELAQVKKKLARETGDTPKASAARKKLGFPVPVRDWLRQEPYTSRVRAVFCLLYTSDAADD